MINAARLLFTSFLLAIALVTPSMARTILYGTVRLNPDVPSSAEISSDYNFPMDLYEFNPTAYDLKYDDSVPLEERVKNLDEFRLDISGNLTLVSFNKITGVYKFKLKLQTYNSLMYLGKSDALLRFLGGTDLKGGGSLKLYDGSTPEFIIEGKLETINGKPHWISFNRNKYFDIKVDYVFHYIVHLKLLQDFPVIVAT